MKRLKIAVLMGGPSAERDVSLKSGTAVANALATTGAKVVTIDIPETTFTIPTGCGRGVRRVARDIR